MSNQNKTKGEAVSELKPLLSDGNGLNLFLIKITGEVQYRMEFEVYEVCSWGENKETGDYDVPSETELYLTGVIKWDGCSHVWFGERENGNQDGYLHLCGLGCWQKHCDMMKKLFELAAKTIVNYNADVAGT